MSMAKITAVALVFLTLAVVLSPALSLAAEDSTLSVKRLTGVLNINQATASQFMRLRGMNEELANKIVAYREAKGEFKKIEDLMKVEGFTEKFYNMNQRYLAISGETTLRWVRVEK